MTAAAAPLSAVDLKGLAQLFALTGGLGIPVGALAYLTQDHMSPKAQVPSATMFTNMPLAQHVGEDRVKLAGFTDTLAGRLNGVPDVYKLLAAGGGGALGIGTGYGVLGGIKQRDTAQDLDAQLNDRKALFEKLLLQEQMAASGVKAADVLEGALETVFDGEYTTKIAAASHTKVSTALGSNQAASAASDLAPALLAILGIGYGASKGWGNTVATDKNRAIAKALRESLDQRLMGNPEGPRAPMIVKVRTDRIGATPVAGGARKTHTRDVLDRL